MFNKEPSMEVKDIIDELVKAFQKANRNDKKEVSVKGNEITIKGSSFMNKASTVKLNDTVEGIILRKYYDKKPKVHIKISYFKVGGKISKRFKDRSKEKNVKYSLSAGLMLTTSIKIKIKDSDKFKVTRTIKYINNNDSEITYEKLSESRGGIILDNLEYLINEENSMNDRIKTATKNLKEWFENKIEQAKDFIFSLKNKIKDKLSSIKVGSNAVISKSIEGTNIKKGDTLNKVKSELKSELSKVESESNHVISDCKEGINSTIKGDIKKANTKKDKVIKSFKVLRNSVVVIGSIVGALHLFSTSIDRDIAEGLGPKFNDINRERKEHLEFIRNRKGMSSKDRESKIREIHDAANKRVSNLVKSHNRNVTTLISGNNKTKRKILSSIADKL